MRLVIQRVLTAAVAIEGIVQSEISKGLVILLGIEQSDTADDANWLVGKVAALRIFDDENGVMNLSVKDVGGEVLVVSQFTLHASTRKGNRPSYIRAAAPDVAIPLYEYFVSALADKLAIEIKTGTFGANMQVKLINDGPVTILIDSKSKE